MKTLTIRAGACALLGLIAGCSKTTVVTPSPQPQTSPSRGPSTAATLGIPPGHLPPPGSCRVWIQGTPPGHQAASRSCQGIESTAPAGSWILYRPTEDKKLVYVRVVDQRRAGVVVLIRRYDADRGTYLGEGEGGGDDHRGKGKDKEKGKDKDKDKDRRY
ncbi:MAG: hypothetical protein ACREMO_04480 [Gemmatimonadales bacterium]